MKKQAIVMAAGALLTLAMTAPSFAEAAKNAAHHARAATTDVYKGYYNSAVPEGNYTGYAPSYSSGGLSGSMGGVGR